LNRMIHRTAGIGSSPRIGIANTGPMDCLHH
jgi:hypothetical protein